MCSISGCIILKKQNRTDIELIDIKNKLVQIIINAEDRGRDSFGVTTLSRQSQIEHFKKIGRPSEHREYLENIPITLDTTIIINNNRAEPTTEFIPHKEAQDIQPFFKCPYIVAHNGTIANDHELIEKYSLTTNTSIDSIVISHLLSFYKPQSFIEHVSILKELLGSFAIAYTNKNYPEALYLAANYNPLYIQFDKKLNTIFFSSLPEYFGEDDLFNESKIQQVKAYTLMKIDSNGDILSHSLLSTKSKRALIVHSGGMDSTVAAAYMKNQGYEITLLHFQYQCRAQVKEEEAVRNIAEYFGCECIFVPTNIFKDIVKGSALTGTGPLYEMKDGKKNGAEYGNEWVPARNFIMLALATGIAESRDFDTIVLGANLEESLTYDQELLLRKGEDIVRIQIGDFVENVEDYQNYEVVSVTKKGKIEFKKVTNTIKHKNTYPHLLQIRDKWGRSIKVTPCHSVMGYDENTNTFTAKEASKLSTNDFLLTSSDIFTGIQNTINIDSNKLPQDKGLRIEDDSFKSKTRSTDMPLQLQLDEHLMEFFGYWIGDGSYDSHSVIISCGLDVEELERKMLEPLKIKFGFNYKTNKLGDSWFNGAVFKYAMQAIGFTGNTYTKEIPDWVFNTDEKLIGAFLRGYFSADGSVSSYISLSSVNEKLIDQVQSLLLMLGIPSTKNKLKKSKLNGKILPGYTYTIIIGGQTLKGAFKDKVGFLLDRKHEKIINTTKNKFKKEVILGAPWISEIDVAFESCRTNLKAPGQGGDHGGPRTSANRKLVDYFLGINKNDRKNRMLIRNKLLKLAEETDNSILKQYVESEVYFTKIKEIVEISPEDYVYDISVEDNENFMLSNGILVHNSNSHPDNTEGFIRGVAATLPYAVQHNKSVKIQTPVCNLMKREIVKLGISLKAPLHLSWSCYEAGELHCGECGPCYMRKTAFNMNNIPEVINYMNSPKV